LSNQVPHSPIAEGEEKNLYLGSLVGENKRRLREKSGNITKRDKEDY
jgi:hypothetical protein